MAWPLIFGPAKNGFNVMLRKMMILTILLFFGTGVGFLLGVASGVELSGHDHSGHDHNVTMDITGNTPSVSMALHPDAISCLLYTSPSPRD